MFDLENLKGTFPLPAEILEEIANQSRKVHFEKGSYILRPGEVQQDLFVILSGVQMSFLETEKKLHVMAFTYPPGFCAVPESFLRQQPSEYFIQCLSETRALALPLSGFQDLKRRHREFESMLLHMTEEVLCGVLQRHRELHTRTMEERYRDFTSRSPHLLQMVPHKYLASYLGIDATNFSKLYNRVRI